MVCYDTSQGTLAGCRRVSQKAAHGGASTTSRFATGLKSAIIFTGLGVTDARKCYSTSKIYRYHRKRCALLLPYLTQFFRRCTVALLGIILGQRGCCGA